jgi:hypothetical protein
MEAYLVDSLPLPVVGRQGGTMMIGQRGELVELRGRQHAGSLQQGAAPGQGLGVEVRGQQALQGRIVVPEGCRHGVPPE